MLSLLRSWTQVNIFWCARHGCWAQTRSTTSALFYNKS